MTATNDWASTSPADIDALVDQFHRLHAQLRVAAPEKFGITPGGASIPPADAVINSDGTVDLNARLRFTNPFDVNATGVGTITVLPDGSLAQFLPLLGQGPRGLSPVFVDPIQNEVPPGEALPNPSIQVNLVNPGDPDANPPTPPQYQLISWVHSGQKGDPGTPVALEFLANILGTPVDASTLIYRVADGYWHVEKVRYITHAAATAFSDANGSSPTPTLASVTVQAKAWAQVPQPFAEVQINPAADGSTKIQLEAHLGGATGPIIGLGQAVQQSTPYICHLKPTALASASSSQIVANQPALVVLTAHQMNGASTSNWSTSCNLGAIFQVDGHPVV